MSATLVREARLSAGLTQAQLAQRLGTTQPAIARLERAGSNPRVGTLDRVLRAAGHRLELNARPAPGTDQTLIAAHVRLTPQQRLTALSASHRNLRHLVRAAKPTR